MENNMIMAFIIGIVLIGIVMKIISLPFKLLKWFITNSILGAIMLTIVNFFGTGIEITFLKALVAGVLGIPGVILIVIMHFL